MRLFVLVLVGCASVEPSPVESPREAERVETPAPPPEREPPAPRRSPPPDAYACEEPGDCVLSCPEAPGCCGYPCGCRHAINKAHAAAYEASYPRTCEKRPCPAVGCAYEPAYGATCRNGRCVGTTGPGF